MYIKSNSGQLTEIFVNILSDIFGRGTFRRVMRSVFYILWLCCIIPSVTSVSIFRHLHYADNFDDLVPIDGVCRPAETSTCDAGFSYNRKICRGPGTWSTISTCFRSCNNGLIQSPINIVSKQTKFISNLPKIVLRPEFLNLVVLTGNNHNHAPAFRVETSKGPDLVIRHPLLESGIFRFHEIHVHLGRDPNRGSEHSVNGVHTPMEAHMVFFNTLKGDTFEEASSQNNGLLVIGVFLEVTKNRVLDTKYFGHPPSQRECKAILKGVYARQLPNVKGQLRQNKHFNVPKPLFHQRNRVMAPRHLAPKIRLRGKKYKIRAKRVGRSIPRRERFIKKEHRGGKCYRKKSRRLSLILECAYRQREVRRFAEPQSPPSLALLFSPSEALPVCRDYYAYKGSLTTPPCTQNVQWIVMRCPIIVSKRVLYALQRVEGYRDGRTLQYFGIRRPTQTNGNFVFRNFRT